MDYGKGVQEQQHLSILGYWQMCRRWPFAKDEKGNATDTGVKEVTDGINVIKDLVLGCVGGVGVIFLAWGLLDFGTGYSAHDTTQQSQAIKKVIGGLIMIAVPAILKLLGVS